MIALGCSLYRTKRSDGGVECWAYLLTIVKKKRVTVFVRNCRIGFIKSVSTTSSKRHEELVKYPAYLSPCYPDSRQLAYVVMVCDDLTLYRVLILLYVR